MYTLLNKGHQLIIQGNFNSENEDLKKWMLVFGLVDIIEKTQPRLKNTHKI